MVTETRVTAEQERALREFHDEIPTRSGHWTHNLEGSYAPRADLETLAALDHQWLYLDRGWREMQWSTHCNTEDERWVLRERGITLTGPDPREFAGEVLADALRSRMRPLIESFLPDLFGWTSFDIAWSQRYAVTTLCRMLYTLDTGEVTSKPASLEWAKHALTPVWHDLIQQVLDDRSVAWDDPPRGKRGSDDRVRRLREAPRRELVAIERFLSGLVDSRPCAGSLGCLRSRRRSRRGLASISRPCSSRCPVAGRTAPASRSTAILRPRAGAS